MSAPSPPRHRHHNGSNGVSMSGQDESNVPEEGTTWLSSSVSPLKAAADLIQTLDLAYAEMTHFAADAAKDAEEARRNARTASEIARRYLHRNYPEVQTSFGGSPSPNAKDLTSGSWSPNLPQHRTIEGGVKEGSFSANQLGSLSPNRHGKSNAYHHGMNGGPALSGPPTPKDGTSKTYDPIHISPSRGRARNHHTPSSVADRIAQSHAEDVLTLSMELERSKQAFQTEERMHDDTKAMLSTQKVKVTTLEEENHRLKQQLEQNQRKSDARIQELEQELAKSKHIVEAAEEDAQLALELAKDSSERRDEMEVELQRVQEELKLLKEKQPETPKRSVRFADESPAISPLPDSMILSTPAAEEKSPSRSMVEAGRQLLRRSSAGSSSAGVITLELTPSKSAERRRRLRERLIQREDGQSLMALMPATPQQESKSPTLSSINTKEPEECRHAAKILQESGRRLELTGHWWRKEHAITPIHEMEAMTRQYCQSVEFKVERQQKEIKELESLCGFLERKLVTGSEEELKTEDTS